VAHSYHDDRARYFEDQCRVTEEYVIPFLEESGALPGAARVLEIGCAEAGVLKAFLQRGATAVGVDRNAGRLEAAAPSSRTPSSKAASRSCIRTRTTCSSMRNSAPTST